MNYTWMRGGGGVGTWKLQSYFHSIKYTLQTAITDLTSNTLHQNPPYITLLPLVQEKEAIKNISLLSTGIVCIWFIQQLSYSSIGTTPFNCCSNINACIINPLLVFGWICLFFPRRSHIRNSELRTIHPTALCWMNCCKSPSNAS